MTRPPDYIVHEVDEKDVTVDWFFARGQTRRRTRQLALMIVGWLFALLPIVITTSALVNRGNPGGWWTYEEGFYLWDTTRLMLGVLLLVFIVGFFILLVLDRVSAGKRNQRRTYDAARLSRRLTLAAHMYHSKYGAATFRVKVNKVLIEPYVDIETYELRDLYREYGLDR